MLRGLARTGFTGGGVRVLWMGLCGLLSRFNACFASQVLHHSTSCAYCTSAHSCVHCTHGILHSHQETALGVS
jgi:hypothetical protein